MPKNLSTGVIDGNVYPFPVKKPDPIVNRWIEEMCELASQGNPMAQDAIAGINEMFPDEELIIYE